MTPLLIGMVVGFAIGCVLMDVLYVQPSRREAEALREAAARKRRHEAEDRLARAIWRHEHLGAQLFDDHNASRKAPLLEVVQ